MSDAKAELSILIVGAGIGGLSTALHLHAAGFTSIRIFESSSSITPLGVGINLQPHAVLLLRNLGLLPALHASAIETADLNYYTQHGELIVREPRGLAAGYAVPQFSVHRGELQMMLLDAVRERLGKGAVRLDHALERFEQGEEEVTAHFVRKPAKGTDEVVGPAEIPTASGHVLLACDGIHSSCRAQLYPTEGPPRFSGRILWRGCTVREKGFLTGRSMVWAGHADQKFIAYPIGGGSFRKGRSLVNWIAELRVRDEGDPDLTPPPVDWLRGVDREKFLPRFVGWRFMDEREGRDTTQSDQVLDVEELVEATDTVYEFPMCDRDPVDRWCEGRMTLMGDAAHPMYPIGSNGASQAILDSEALVTAFLSLPQTPSGLSAGVASALQAYEKQRRPPTTAIVLSNRANGPDQVLQLVYERAPDGLQGRHVHDIVPEKEIDEVGRKYKQIAGFEVTKVNAMAVESEGVAERAGLRSPKGWQKGDERL
ncbi:FAD/NAD(P)-binding domain-containing protein [Eremomyces bilateralis CBS 781.70]|uniref:FAD/NAD(P)-binding domain-containing protein n=1 Tax=Eremomyces bilateralis CBS 781.70 TaxID=1392243 RepID=A0A6G1FWL4_9PEZI|nr:FAD/NAD(P)-binding domain-containing protein [Eremomyces bilateralis CBS 781.70]KAF1810092.1 FAD/NAD(P)-binding domain-containing protein [Eremomyces bilateralis CBS 781.70]